LTPVLRSIRITFSMRRAAYILALALGCLISSDVSSAVKPIPLVLEERTNLRVGELAVLHIPLDSRYSHSSGTGGAYVLTFVRRSKRDMTFRAVRPGLGVIIMTPDVPRGECISCATLHYFINVVPQEWPYTRLFAIRAKSEKRNVARVTSG
jgi:hypothetical protein